MKLNEARGRGFAMFYVLLFMFIMIVLVFALNASGIHQLFRVANVQQSVVAYYAAQSGVNRALYNVKSFQQPDCGFTAFSGTLANGAIYQSTLTSGIHSGGSPLSCSSPVSAPDGTAVPQNLFYIKSTGAYGNITRTSKAWYKYGGKGWPFPYAAFGDQVGLGPGAYTDSYNSFLGPYGGMNLSANGNIGVNTGNIYAQFAGAGDIMLQNGATVNGSVSVGPGGVAGPPTVQATSCPGSQCTGGISVLPQMLDIPFPPVDPNGGPGTTPPAATNPVPPGKYSAFNVVGTTWRLNCGVYSVGSIDVINGTIKAPLCGAGNPVKIYVYSSFSMNTGTLLGNTREAAPGVFIYMMLASGGSVNMLDSTATMSLFDPYGPVNANGSEIYGSIVGEAALGKVHYDEALNGPTQAGLQILKRMSWQTQ